MPFVSKRSLFIGPSSYSARRAAANGGEVSMKCDLNVDSWTEVQCYDRRNKRVKSRYGLVSAHVRYWPLADISLCAAHVRFQGQSRHDLLRVSAFAVAIGCKADMGLCAAYVCF